jgi:hypothetical protein
MAISKSYSEQAAPGAASDILFVRPGDAFTWSSVGTIDALCEVALQVDVGSGAWRDLKRWFGGAAGASISETGTVLNESAGPQRYRFDARVPTTDPVTVLTAYAVSATEAANTLEETRNAAGTTVLKITDTGIEAPIVTATAQVVTDTIAERTSAAGVTIDGVKLKDSQAYTDQINEKTSAAGVTVDGLLVKDGGMVMTTGRIQANHSGTSGSIIRGFGKTAAEGWQEMIVEATVSFVDNIALSKNITGANLAAGTIILGVLANIESAVTGGGTTTKIGIGIAGGDEDVYGLSAALTKNAKITPVPVLTPLAAQSDIALFACANNGAAGDTALTVGSVRVRILCLTPIALADAP